MQSLFLFRLKERVRPLLCLRSVDAIGCSGETGGDVLLHDFDAPAQVPVVVHIPGGLADGPASLSNPGPESQVSATNTTAATSFPEGPEGF